ncbi:MAG: methyltransferase domain-containing protein [bacterium]|nr:methyltransferase domain-containing protein [bacterium]
MKEFGKKEKWFLKKKKSTSWGKVAGWYDDYLEMNEDSYQRQVILPNLLRVLEIRRGARIFDVACGQGFFTREFARLGARVMGADISRELIEYARAHSPREIIFYVSPAHQLSFVRAGGFDIVTIVLAIQNIQNISEVFAEARRLLKPSGRLVLVLNHPVLRVPKNSSWGWDTRTNAQYRRIDRYLSTEKVDIVMHPGIKNSEHTISYHRSLQNIFGPLSKNGFAVSRLEEWISHRKSQKGPRQKVEDIARKEFPLFLMLEARKL